MKVVLISCVKRKMSIKCKAEDLYMGPLFKNSLCLARKMKADKIYILSAKHHLLPLEEEIEPYSLTLKNFKRQEKIDWGKKVIEQLSQVSDLENDVFVVLAGKEYINPIKDNIRNLEDFLKDLIY
jgi:hypothetical protein